MTRIRLILLSMIAVLGISAAASVASAAAAEPLTRYSVEGIGEITESLAIEGNVGTAQLNGLVLGNKLMIECTENKLISGSIKPTGKSEGEINFAKCTVFLIKSKKESQAGKCAVVEPIKFNFTDLLIVGPGGLIEDEFKPTGAENNFVTIEIKKVGEEGCPIAGKYETKGSYVASLGAEGEVLKTEHELVFTSTGSKVKLGKEPASFTNRTTIKLVDGKSWLVG